MANLLFIFFSLIFLGNFKLFVLGQQSSVIINDKIYFLGGYSNTSQTIHSLDLSTKIFLNQTLSIKEIIPNPNIPPFYDASFALGGTSNNILYLISGHRNSFPGTNDYGSPVYSINTNLFDKWVPETLNGQSKLVDIDDTIYTQDNDGNTFITGYGDKNIYKFNIKDLSISKLNPINNGPSITTNFVCHLLNDKETMVYIGVNLTEIYLYNVRENKWSTIATIGDKPTSRYGFSSVLAPDGRIIVYGGTSNSDKLAILNTTQNLFQWTIPKNITYPIKEYHYGHTSNLYGNYMIIAFGRIQNTNFTIESYSNILVLDISDKINYKWLDTYVPPNSSNTTTPSNNNASSVNKNLVTIIVGSIAPLVAIAIAIFLIVFFVKRSKRRRCIHTDNNFNNIDKEEKNTGAVLDNNNNNNNDNNDNDNNDNNDNDNKNNKTNNNNNNNDK